MSEPIDFSYVMPSGINAGKTAAETYIEQVVVTDSLDDCWEWQGQVYRNGYGRFNYKDNRKLAHRVMVMFCGKPLERKDVVCHTCDNRKCCNPAHLIVADQQYNMQDAWSKGRMHAARGENAGLSKLDNEAVSNIRYLRENGMWCKHINLIYPQVSAKQISIVSRGLQWSHID